ncbi:hypothetical protein [Bradyrhizobium genosp. A]
MSNFADYLRKHGEQDAQEAHCAPIVGHGRCSAMITRARRASSELSQIAA